MGRFKKGQSGNPSGRPRGSKNKLSADLRDSVSQFLSGEFEHLKSKLGRMDTRDRMRFFTELLPYALPRLQSTSLEKNFEAMTNEQLDEIIEKLKQEAYKHQGYEIEPEAEN